MTEIKYLLDLKAMQLNCTNAVRFNTVKLFTDGTYKYCMFAIKNLFNQAINNISFTLTQYDKDNRVLKREVISITDNIFKKKRNTAYKKLNKVHINTDHVDFEIIHIDFITICFDNGSISYIGEKPKKLPKINSKPIKSNESYFINVLKCGGLIGIFIIFVVIIITILAVIFDHLAFNEVLGWF